MSTIYVRNLNEKTSIPKLKEALSDMFGKHGTVSEVRADKGIRKRGQAFVTFDKAEEATAAITELDGSDFLGKKIQVTLAHAPSDLLFGAKEGDAALLERKAARDTKRQAAIRRVALTATTTERSGGSAHKKPRLQADANPPHSILFVQDLPPNTSLAELANAYADVRGFVEARVVAARNVGFVEFMRVEDAVAIVGRELTIRGVPATVSYAKK